MKNIKNKKLFIIVTVAVIALVLAILLAIFLPKPNEGEGECNHSMFESLVEPTEKSQGYILHKCDKCGYSYKDNYTPARGSMGLEYMYAPTKGEMQLISIGDCVSTEITVPVSYDGQNVLSIANEAFLGSSIKRVNILGSLNNIGDFAFAGCKNLTDIYFSGTLAEWESIEKGKDWNKDMPKYTVHCTDSNMEYSFK